MGLFEIAQMLHDLGGYAVAAVFIVLYIEEKRYSRRREAAQLQAAIESVRTYGEVANALEGVTDVVKDVFERVE